MRKRLRPKHDKATLDRLYGKLDEPMGHPDHRLRIPVSNAVCDWMIREYDLQTGADLSCGDGQIILGTRLLSDNITLGDLAEVEGEGYDAWEDFVHGPIEETILDLKPVDLFVCCETLEHVDDPDWLLSRIREKCKALVLSTPVSSWNDPTEGHYWAWDRGEIDDMLMKAGFSSIDTYSLLWFGAPELFQTFGIWGAR